MYVCVPALQYVYLVPLGPSMSEEAIGSAGAKAINNCEIPDMLLGAKLS